MPWYPSAKACPAAIKPTVQCFFPTLYQVLLFDFSSFGEKLFFCLRGYAAQSREARCKNSRSAERCARRRVSERNRRKAALGAEITQEGETGDAPPAAEKASPFRGRPRFPGAKRTETGWADGVFLPHAGRKDFFDTLKEERGWRVF